MAINKTAFPSLLILGCLFPAASALAQDSLQNIVGEGRFFGALRYRYEYVDQNGPAPIASVARAGTMRANLGFKTGKYHGFQGLLEAQFVENIGATRFNDSVNGKTTHPVIADPDTQEINQAWLSWDNNDGARIKLGRQLINLDNQRFIGSVDWRQNDQSFDALLLHYNFLENTTLTYGYIGNVNRVFGDDHPLGDLDSKNHILNASYKISDSLTVAGYGYFLSFDRLPARSSKTFGVRATGRMAVNDDWAFSYEAETAYQGDYGDHPVGYHEHYYHIAPSFSAYGWILGAGYEVLGGDGRSSFQTPLATLHKFNGWADKFLDTPAAGLEDVYASVSWKIPVSGALSGVTLSAVYHDFKGQERGDFGSELDVSIAKTFDVSETTPFKNINIVAKYADYNAQDRPYTDTQKAWLQLGVNF